MEFSTLTSGFLSGACLSWVHPKVIPRPFSDLRVLWDPSKKNVQRAIESTTRIAIAALGLFAIHQLGIKKALCDLGVKHLLNNRDAVNVFIEYGLLFAGYPISWSSSILGYTMFGFHYNYARQGSTIGQRAMGYFALWALLIQHDETGSVEKPIGLAEEYIVRPLSQRLTRILNF